MSGDVTAQYFTPDRYREAVALKEARGAIMSRTTIRMQGVDWPHYEVRFVPPRDPATIPWALRFTVKGDEGWAS